MSPIESGQLPIARDRNGQAENVDVIGPDRRFRAPAWQATLLVAFHYSAKKDRMMRVQLLFAGVFLVLVSAGLCRAQESRSSLIIVGGGLLANNNAVFDRLVESAKVGGRIRFGIFPTASVTDESAERFTQRLMERGITSEQIQIFDVKVENAAQQAEDPVVAE